MQEAVASPLDEKPTNGLMAALRSSAIWIVFAAVLLIAPHIFDSRSGVSILNDMGILIIFALSYNMLLGQSGMLSFGHAVYFGLGGFVAVHTLNLVADEIVAIPTPLVPLIGGLTGLFFGIVIGSSGVLAYAEQRALELGIAIAGGADTVLLDEPIAGMSHSEAQDAVALIKRVTKDKTLILVEHDMGVIFDIADRISVLVYGQIIATDTPENIRGNAAVQEAYLGKAEEEDLEHA